MKDIVRFVVGHWEIISSSILMVACFILSLLKKRPLANTFQQWLDVVVCCLPEMINKAEKTGCTGSYKKEQVISEAISLLNRLIKCTDRELEDAKDYFSARLENILSTPQKKDK